MHQVVIHTLSFLILSVNSFADAQGVTCSSATLSSATVTGNCPSTPPGGTCVFSCAPGYTDNSNQGVYSLRCGNDGRWQGVIPVCNIISCPDLAPAAGGYNSGTCIGAQPGNTCGFSCPQGSQLVGPSVLTCGQDSFWDYQPPSCRGGCYAHNIPFNGQSNGICSGALPADVCYFTCNPGFRMRGSPSSTCLIDGTWTSHAPSCN